MNLQYIEDNNGLLSGVFIPIDDWNKIKDKVEIDNDIPDWQKEIIAKAENNGSFDLDKAKSYEETINKLESI
jgi:hypothetical protein